MNDYIAKPVDERLLYSKIIGLVTKPVQMNTQTGMIPDPIEIKKCIDLSYLQHRTKSNSALMMEMIALYLEQTPVLIAAMKQGILEKKLDMVQSAVHKMIPSFSIMGISTDYENIAKKIHEFVRTKQEEEIIAVMILQLEIICTQACNELQLEFTNLKNTRQ
jgi:hypothetical protein